MKRDMLVNQTRVGSIKLPSKRENKVDFSSVNPSVEREKAVHLQQSVTLRSRACALRSYVYYLYIGTNDVI